MNNYQISSILTAYRCIRQYYLQKAEDIQNSISYTICKQISSAEISEMNRERVWESIILIEQENYLDFRSKFDDYYSANLHTPLRQYTDLDIQVRNKKWGMYGLLDKFSSVSQEGTVIRARKAPETGCWPEDRIRITALQLCIEESLNTVLKGLYVEYIPSGIVRYYEPGPRDRRTLIQTIARMKKVDEGDIAPKPANPPCKGCRYHDTCDTGKPRSLLQIFKKGE